MIWRCPICRQPTDSATDADFPLCGPRCRLIDLGHWAAEDYRVREPADTASESNPGHDDRSHDS